MSENDLKALRHTLAHLLGASILEIYPGSKLTLGPAIDDGFYYDAEIIGKVNEEDLQKIESKMRELLKTWNEFSKKDVSPEEALEYYKENVYKLELINEHRDAGLTFYTCGNFTDLCRGGHIDNAQNIPSDCFKLDRVAGAYWRGDEKNKMLTRIYGLAFETREKLNEYIAMREEARKRDHKILGAQLDLFTFSPLVGQGLPLFTPKGTIIRDELDGFVWDLRKKYGYERVDIPHITKKELYETSGHWDKFKDDLFRINTREGHEFAMKPMNCPHHTQIYNRKKWSYRELPQRYASTTKVYRDEQSGELGGLSRVRSITQDDAHVFCRLKDANIEMGNIYQIIKTFYGSFGFTLQPRLSMHDENNMGKYLGTKETWENSVNALRDIIKQNGETAIEAPGEAAFYGPKIDFLAKDAIGRMHQVATIQLDMNMPERFDLSCTNEEGKEERIVMVHAAIMGSIERFMSVLIEHTAGVLPTFLSPVQVAIVPVKETHNEYAENLKNYLKENNVRVEVEDSNDSLGKRINHAKAQKTPYVIVVGDKELESGNLTIETKTEKISKTKKEFMELILEEIKTRK